MSEKIEYKTIKIKLEDYERLEIKKEQTKVPVVHQITQALDKVMGPIKRKN